MRAHTLYVGAIAAALAISMFAYYSPVLAAHNADGLAGYWNFDEGSGTTAADSAHTNDGTIIGTAAYETIPALTAPVPGNDSALIFDGDGDYVEITNDPELDMTSAYSISTWVNVTDVPAGTYRPIAFRGATNSNDIEVYVQWGSGDLIVAHNRGNGGGFDFVGFDNPPVGGLFHLVVTYDGTNVQAYYDGAAPLVVQGTTAVTAPLDTDKGWWLGKVDHAAFAGTHLFKGLLDEMRIYDSALSSDEVADLMEDADGVLGGDDLCPGTVSDVGTWDEAVGTNRWELGDDGRWYQNKKKGGLSAGSYDIADTYGCSGQQILAMLDEELGAVMNGHHKFGLSSGVLEEFILDMSDGVLDGLYYLETVPVPANDPDEVSSVGSLLSGHDYLLKASGTADACVSGCGYSIIFDPEYSTSDGLTWVDGVAAPYDGDPNLLDLLVDGSPVNWDDDATYNTDHTYSYVVTGADAPVSFMVSDLYYPNNSIGSLTVDIYAQI